MHEKSNSSDATLILQYQGGNKEALVELVKRWHKVFCNKAYWIVKDADLAKDVAQDSWRTIMTKIDDLEDPKNFGSWSMRIVFTKSLDTISHNKKNRSKREQYVRDYISEAEYFEGNDSLKHELLIAIKSLSLNQQATIRLFYVEEYSLKEISVMQQISIGTAKSRLFYAREKLKQILINRNYEN